MLPLHHPAKRRIFEKTLSIRTIIEPLRKFPPLLSAIIQDLTVDPDFAAKPIFYTIEIITQLMKFRSQLVELPPEGYDLIGGSDDHMKPQQGHNRLRDLCNVGNLTPAIEIYTDLITNLRHITEVRFEIIGHKKLVRLLTLGIGIVTQNVQIHAGDNIAVLAGKLNKALAYNLHHFHKSKTSIKTTNKESKTIKTLEIKK